MPSNRKSYQLGTVERVSRVKGPDQWVYRWWEKSADGRSVHRSMLIGSVEDLPTLADAKREVDTFRAGINGGAQKSIRMTVRECWEHFQLNELRDPDVGRSATTIQNYLDDFACYIILRWGDVALDDVKSVAVEKWLRSLTRTTDPTKPLAPGTRAKIRNQMSALFSHAIRHELYTKLNPIQSVRQGAQRLRDPDVLTLDEIRAILANIGPLAIRVMVAVAAASALRRSEIRGLRWEDLDLENLWFNTRRGVVGKDETRMKTRASRKGVPMHPALAELLRAWREKTPYPADDAWVFASPHTDGDHPYWPDSALKNHIRPAVAAAKVDKRVGWHTFRHSLGTQLKNNGEDVKTIQELLRHANSRITTDIYLQGNTDAKRAALNRVSGIFALPSPAS